MGITSRFSGLSTDSAESSTESKANIRGVTGPNGVNQPEIARVTMKSRRSGDSDRII